MENNINLTGDEARILIAGLRTSNVSAPMDTVTGLYLKLSVLSQVQPPTVQTNQETSNNEGK